MKVTTPTAPVNGGTSRARAKELRGAFANLNAAVASTPESHPDFEKLTGRERTMESAALHEGKVATAHDPADPHSPKEDYVDIAFSLPSSAWEELKEHSVLELLTTDEIVERALREYFETNKAVKRFEDRTGVSADELIPLIHRAGIAAVLEYTRDKEEVTIPLRFALVPSGTAPIFVEERDARFHREVAAACNVDPDQYVGDWLHSMVDDSLNGQYDVDFHGISQDMVDEFNNEDGTPHTPEQKAGLFEQIRGIAYRYQQEVKEESQQAAAMEDGGVK